MKRYFRQLECRRKANVLAPEAVGQGNIRKQSTGQPDRTKQTGNTETASNGNASAAGRGRARKRAETTAPAPDRKNARKGGCPARPDAETMDSSQDSHKRMECKMKCMLKEFQQ